jgi:hypothetical protein
MYKSKYSSSLKNIPNSRNISNRRKNYLTVNSCDEIQKVLRKDYFERLRSASLNKLINYVNEDDERNNKNLNIEEMNEKPLKYAAKQILFSDKIRKNNFNLIKKSSRKRINTKKDEIKIPSEDLIYLDKENNTKKNSLFKPKKIYIDKFPIYYNYNYIDEVENKFIKPFLNKDNIIYKDYLENKKSKMPFNFIIG